MAQPCRLSGAASALSALSALTIGAWAQNQVLPVLYSSNPVARHVACPVAAGSPALCTLGSFEANGRPVEYHIVTLPATGTLYETSQSFRTYGTDPKYAPAPILEHQLPFRVSDVLARVVYVPPSDIFPPEGRWAAFTYRVQVPSTGEMSEPGQVALSSPAQFIAGSTFIGGVDSWTLAGNIHSTTPTWQAFGWGLLNRYIYGTDEVQYLDFETNSDQSKWYFEAPQGKFYLPEMAAAYGGTLRFTIAATYGDFSRLNSPLDFVTLECSSCNSGRGIRIVRFADNGLEWDGSERVVQITLATGNFWRRDPMSGALPFTDATECEIAAVLAGLTRLRILGDFTRAGEGVALDDVSVAGATSQPAVPVPCQQGCVCAHDPRDRRMSCCGSSAEVFYPFN